MSDDWPSIGSFSVRQLNTSFPPEHLGFRDVRPPGNSEVRFVDKNRFSRDYSDTWCVFPARYPRGMLSTTAQSLVPRYALAFSSALRDD